MATTSSLHGLNNQYKRDFSIDTRSSHGNICKTGMWYCPLNSERRLYANVA